MFVATGTLRKPDEYELARCLRADGLPLKRIAALVGVSVSSVHGWTRDIELTPEQLQYNRRGPTGPQNPESVAARAASWSRKCRENRRAFQEEGAARARMRDPFHMAGSMLYWAEGSKKRNQLCFANSDLAMMGFFGRFLRRSLDVPVEGFRIRINVYTGNNLTIDEIQARWLAVLEAPKACLRKPVINHFPTSSSGRKTNRLPYGVCDLRVAKSTHLVQHILGAIQEYGGFDEPRWLD